MQHKAMQLMSRKMAASQALEGEFSEDGLAAMAGEDNMQMALAKQLSQRISEADMQRNWGKVKSGSKKKVSSKLDLLPPEAQDEINAATAAQILAETLEESEGKEPPIEAAREFAGVLERIAQVDHNFKLLAPTFADDEYEDAGLEKELDDETGEEYEVEPQPKPVELKVLSDDEPEGEEEDFDIPELTPEIMMKMFANMQANGMM